MLSFLTLKSGFKPGQTCFLDGKTKVIVVKSFVRSLTKYLVRLPDTDFQLVDGARLTRVLADRT
jgi:hypothetical protein